VLFGHFSGVRTVFLEDARRGKFTQLVAHHVLGHEDRDECFAIMNVESVSDKIRRDRAAAGPGFDGFFAARFIHFVDFVEEFPLDVGTFFK